MNEAPFDEKSYRPNESVDEFADQSVAAFAESVIWTAGDHGLESFYVYGLLCADGKIFAFAEGRIGRRDAGAHHIVCKISADNGRTWGETSFVVKSDAGETYSNPTPILNEKTGEIFLFYARNFANDRTELFLKTSVDAGASWSNPRNLTALFAGNRYGWTLHLPGPGHGIQTRTGRLIVPVWHRRALNFPAAERAYGISFVTSDDGGKTWKNGGAIPPDETQLNESRIVELNNGDLVLIARSGAFVASPKFFSKSADGGRSWSAPFIFDALSESFATDGGFVNLTDGREDRLIFLRPDGVVERKNLNVYYSGDVKKGWRKKTIYKGVAGYSDAAVLPDRSIGVIYGRDLLIDDADVEGNIRETVFARFNRKWLETAETRGK